MFLSYYDRFLLLNKIKIIFLQRIKMNSLILKKDNTMKVI